MMELTQTDKKTTRLEIEEGVGYGPPGTTALIQELVERGDLVLRRPYGEWPAT
jgi:hypothetical protein